MPNKQQKIELDQVEIRAKLNDFRKQAQKSFKSTNLPSWWIENVTKNKVHHCLIEINVPRISLLRQAVDFLFNAVGDKKLLDQVFLQQPTINQILYQSEHMVDIAFILRQHTALKVRNNKVQYGKVILDSIQTKMEYWLEKQNKKLPALLRVSYVESFIEFKLLSPKLIYDRLTPYELSELRQEIFLMYEYLFRPYMQKCNVSKYLYQLADIVCWNIILEDDTTQKERLVLDLNEKISNIICSRKRSDGVFNYFRCFQFLMNMLSVNYRKEDPFKVYLLAPLMNLWEQQMRIDEIKNWLQIKGKTLQPCMIQNIFRNTYHVGSSIFLFNLIELFSKALKERKEFNILYHLYLSYIKKEYLDIVLPNSTFIQTYFKILQFYVIGFINQDRLDGESQLDKLTNNLTSLLINKKFTYKKHYHILITFYKVYEARFSYLSSVSRKFLVDLQKIYKYQPQLLDIHNKIHQAVFREANFPQQQNSGFQQLNVKRTDRYRGLMNLGNTCYMNSFMQAMFMTKKFRSAILDIRDQLSISSNKNLFYALTNLFTELSTKTIGTDSEVIPELFKMETPQPFKSSWQQHDVGQFGRMYFQSLVNELEDDKVKQRVQKIFSNKIRKSLICYVCKTQKSSIQQVFDFILHLNKSDDTILVSKLLSEYFKGEELSGQNQVICERCRKKTNSLSRPHPLRLAEFLMITIGLFEYSGGGKKIKKPFSFEFVINFSKILPNENVHDQNYELYAFIVHIGNEAERGHYICYARNLQENPTIWYCFDDGYVTERTIETVSEFQFGESETPYMLFYSGSRKRKSVQINPEKLGSQIFTK